MARSVKYVDRIAALKKATSILRKGWTTDHLAIDADGRVAPVLDDRACKFCLDGALRKACNIDGNKNSPLYNAVADAVAETLSAQEAKLPEDSRFWCFVEFNDAQEDAKPVIKLLTSTIKRLKAKVEKRRAA